MGAQVAATRDALIALVRAHVDLAKAEAGAIAGEVGRVAAFGALALALILAAVILALVGIPLWSAEWLLGSMGWGVLHGVLAFVSIAVAAALLALGVPGGRLGRALLAAIIVAIVVGLALGLELPNRLYAVVGDRTGLGLDPGIRPLVVGMLIWGLIGLIGGILAAATMDLSGGGRVAALAGLTIVGIAIGAVTAITFGPQVGAGLGITVGYLAWITSMGTHVARTGIDLDALKKRFYPVQTIDTSKETLEWLQKRMPPGIGS